MCCAAVLSHLQVAALLWSADRQLLKAAGDGADSKIIQNNKKIPCDFI